MPRPTDNLTEIIHLRVTPDIKAWYKEFAKRFGVSEAESQRLALAIFKERGGVAYAKDDN